MAAIRYMSKILRMTIDRFAEMNRNSVDIKVGKIIRQWVLNIYGADYVLLDKHSNLWFLIKQYLQLLPDDYHPIEDRSEYISFFLLVNGEETTAHQDHLGRIIQLNMLYRCYIPEEGQVRIRRYLENQFRHAFIVFMTARQGDESGEKITRSIADFLLTVGVDVDRQLLGRLMKYWYRWRVKTDKKPVVQIFF